MVSKGPVVSDLTVGHGDGVKAVITDRR